MATRRNLDQGDPAPVLPPGAELWQPKPLEDLAAEPDTLRVERIDDLFGQGDAWAEPAEYEQFLNWVQKSRRTEG
jgi:hypothetical protein